MINRHEFAVVMNNMGEKLTSEEIQVLLYFSKILFNTK